MNSLVSIKAFVKKSICALYPFAYFLPHFSKPYLCVITPVFDGCLSSLESLIHDLQQQYHSSWMLVCVSNGQSPLIASYIEKASVHDRRIWYLEMPHESEDTPIKLLINIGKRRNYAMKHVDALRYMFIDADSALENRHFIAQLMMIDSFIGKDLIMVHTKLADRLLPEIPVQIGTMDMTNMVFSDSIAKECSFPTDYDPAFHGVSDYRYFLRINKPHNTLFAPIMGCVKNVRRSYVSVAERFRVNPAF